jgi:hypothetical protein
MKKNLFIVAFGFIALIVNAQLPSTFDASLQADAPDYSSVSSWAALPFSDDKADIIPRSSTWVSDSLKKVDVFYIYPTIYGKKHTNMWCADINDKSLNKKIDNKPVKYQASAFNETARVYAPRYRQAHIDIFDDTTLLREIVLDFAYQDVKKAFEYYLAHYNQGRPIIIASHSQGTVHGRRLIKEFFDNPSRKQQLVCAYLVGFALYEKDYEHLKPCKNAEETNCYVSWSSFKHGYEYPGVGKDLLVGEVAVNPISWRIDATSETDKGSILLSIKQKKTYETTAQIKDKMLWVKTRAPFLSTWNTLHVADYNLFWYNIRKNIALRSKQYFENR